MRKDQGSVAVILSVAMVALLGFSGLAIDAGMTYIERTKLSNALDASVLAAAQELPDGSAKAISIAEQYLESNEVSLDSVNILVSPDGKSIEIIGNRNVPHYFMKVLGIDSTDVTANSKAIIAPVKSVKGGIRPFAVEDFAYVYGDLITLKQGAGDSYNGNFGVVALGGTGSSIYEYNALYGYDGELKIGDEIPTEPGNMAGVSNQLKAYINSIYHTFENHPKNSDRLWTVPIVDTLEVSGRDYLTITGFAQVFVEDIDKKSGKINIDARFVKFVVNGAIDMTAQDHGVYGVKLVN
jgi:hypothetical protein